MPSPNLSTYTTPGIWIRELHTDGKDCNIDLLCIKIIADQGIWFTISEYQKNFPMNKIDFHVIEEHMVMWSVS